MAIVLLVIRVTPFVRAFIGAAIIIGLTACGSDSSSTMPSGSGNKTYDINTFNQTFLPTIQDIAVGDTVRWTFSVAGDNLGHNILFQPRIDGAPPDFPFEIRSGTRSAVFTTKGEFHYVCALHGAMTGVIIVR